MLASCLHAQAGGVALTPAERQWIADHPVVRIGNPALPPYHFTESGRAVGYQVEVTDALLRQVGLQAKYEEMPLAVLLDGLKSGSFDVVMDPIYVKERESFLAYSSHGFDTTLGIFARYDSKDIADLALLQGKRIASYRNYALEAKLRKLLPDAEVVQADDSTGMLRLVSSGAADFCVVEVRSGEYILQKARISNVATKGVFRVPGEAPVRVHDYGVRRSAPLLVSILDKSAQALDPAEKDRIWKRWFFGSGSLVKPIDLGDDERAWLAAGHTVRARIADFPPYMMRQPEPSGIVVDYLRAVADRIGFRIEFVPAQDDLTAAMGDLAGEHRHYDVLSLLVRTPERERAFAMTQDIFTSPQVIYTRNDSPLLTRVEDLNGKTVAAERGYVVVGKLRAAYPNIRILEVARAAEALEAVATGRADAYIGNLTNASYIIKQQRLSNLMVAAPAPFGNYMQAVAVRQDWAPLASLIDKGIAAMPADELNAIQQKWGVVEMAFRIDYTLVWQIVAAAAALLAAFVYWNRRLAREIERRRLVELDLQKAREAAENASQAKSTFLANMSHELRTPMNAIMGMNRLALRRSTDDRQRDQLGKIDQASQHLLALINDILDISKIEADRLTLERVNFSLGDLLDKHLNLMVQRAREKGLKLRVEAPNGLVDLSLVGDPLRLSQLLFNLTGNAIKFTEIGSVVVRADAVEENAASVLLRFEVRDTGIGIAADKQKKLFTAFEQGDGSMTRKYGGSGLGLAISKRLARLMGGDIGVTSEVGWGSTFWFTARLEKASVGDAAAAPASALRETPAQDAEQRLREDFAGTRVLLAEDEPVNREVSRGLLEDAGLSVDVAEDGAQAVDLAGRNAYALILMDMQMPNLNGIDATRAIRTNSPNRATPILAMTANAFEEDRRLCLDAGMNDHIAKPIDPARLFDTLLRWLERKGP